MGIEDLEKRYKNTCDIVNKHSRDMKILLDRIKELEDNVSKLLKIIEKKDSKADFEEIFKMFGIKK